MGNDERPASLARSDTQCEPFMLAKVERRVMCTVPQRFGATHCRGPTAFVQPLRKPTCAKRSSTRKRRCMHAWQGEELSD